MRKHLFDLMYIWYVCKKVRHECISPLHPRVFYPMTLLFPTESKTQFWTHVTEAMLPSLVQTWPLDLTPMTPLLLDYFDVPWYHTWIVHLICRMTTALSITQHDHLYQLHLFLITLTHNTITHQTQLEKKTWLSRLGKVSVRGNTLHIGDHVMTLAFFVAALRPQLRMSLYLQGASSCLLFYV